MDKQLKIFALEYIKEHDGLLKEERLALGQFVMEASDNQVKFMLFTGEVKDKLSEEDITYIKELDPMLFPGANPGEKIAFGAGFGSGLAVVAYSALIAVAAVKAYKKYISKAGKACKGLLGNEKTNCLNKFKKQAQVAKIKTFQSGLSKCSKTKNPVKCKAKLQSKINKEKAKMGAL